MKDGICPKCNSTEIYAGTNMAFKGGIVISFLRYIGVDYYVCAMCGYVESYLSDLYDLSEIKKKWSKVPSIDNKDKRSK